MAAKGGTVIASEGRLSRGWRRWIAENVLLGVVAEQIEAKAVAAGVDRELVRAEVDCAKADPYIEAGSWVAQKLRKLESILQVRVEVARQNSAPRGVACRSQPSAAEFREHFYARNRPIKLLHMLDDWPAMAAWCPSYFRDRYGSAIVEATVARDSNPNYEINLEQHRRRLRFSNFVDLVTSSAGNDSYLVANNHFFQQPDVAGLLDDVGRLPGYLNEHDRLSHTYLWFGGAGTVTPLHHDTMNVLFCQIYGSKRVLLIDPDETPWLYNDLSVYSEVRIEEPDLARYPLVQHVAPVEVIMNPGEILFIPVGWWHCVRSLDTSISISATNFEFPNSYVWRHPDIRRNA